jgi:hypothetical protein
MMKTKTICLTLALAASGCSQLLGLEDPPAQPDAGTDATIGCGSYTQIRDPGFTEPTAWQTVGGGVVDFNAPGYADVGLGKIVSAAGSLSQATCIATPNADYGLVLTTAVAVDPTGSDESIAARASVGGQTRTIGTAYTGMLAPATVCLGDSAYGSNTLTLAGLNVRTGSTISFDSVAIASIPATTCPAAGTVRSGDFENAAAWSPPEFIEGGTGARRLHLRGNVTSCNGGEVWGLASIPAGITSPALVFEVSGSLGMNSEFNVYVRADESYAQPVHLTALPALPQLQVACIPREMRGQVIDVYFGIFQTTMCPSTIEAYIDDVMVVSSPSCP